MNRLLAVGIWVLSMLLLPMSSLAEDVISGEGQLDIQITNIKNASGTMHVSLQNSPEGWLSAQKITSTDDIGISVEGLNDNLELDTYFCGLPKEPCGFSGPMGMMGPPKFVDAAVEVGAGKNRIELMGCCGCWCK